MKKLFKPAALLFNLLVLITFFFVGLFFAKFIEAGNGQMLAAGAIVLGYGVIFAGVGFIGSLFLTYWTSHKIIIRLNAVLFTLLLLLFGYFYVEFQKREETKPITPKNTTAVPTTSSLLFHAG